MRSSRFNIFRQKKLLLRNEFKNQKSFRVKKNNLIRNLD